MDDPLRLMYSTQVLDKVSLGVLLGLYASVRQDLRAWDLLIVLGYLVLFDLILSNGIAAFYPEELLTRFFKPLQFFFLALSPIVLVMGHLSRLGKARSDEEDDEEDPEDISAFLRAGAEEGIIEEREKDLLRNLLIFSNTVVREVMTPRTDMVCVEHDGSPEEILQVFKKTKYSRLPVYRENIDHIEGVLRFKDLIEMMDTHQDITSYLTETRFVPEQKNIYDLLQELLKSRMQMAVVVDEYGGTAGVITLEDLIEEIVGEIHDEHEAPESDEIIKLENGDYLMDGKIPLEDFCEMYDAEPDSQDIDTVGGYIFNMEGRIPEQGSTSQVCGVPVEIARADNRRIYQIRVSPPTIQEVGVEE